MTLNQARFEIMKFIWFLLLITLVVFSLVQSTLATAAALTDQSAKLSNTSKAATAVDYNMNFSVSTLPAGTILVQFCKTTPLIGELCDLPAGFSAAGATATGASLVGMPTANLVIVNKTLSSGANEFTLGNITNPTSAGTIYARVLTYVDATAAGSYSADGTTIGSPQDQGSVAIAISDTIGVSGSVLETMTFCISGTNITGPSCNAGVTSPNLTLGKNTEGVVALDADDVYSGTIYTQISTNAISGAVINLNSSAIGCGGLVRSGSATNAEGCGIAPALASGITPGQAKFGVKTGTINGVGVGANGVLQAYGSPSAYYNDSTYKLNYIVGDASGVTSAYGDPFLDTNGQPVNNIVMPLTFGASVSNITPAGLYSVSLGLVATGKF